MITFKKIDLFTATREEWNNYHKIRREFHLEEFPNEPITSDKATEIMKCGYAKGFHLVVGNFLIYDNNKLVGLLSYDYYGKDAPSYKGNEKIVHFDISLLRNYRRKGIGTKSLQLLIDQCEPVNKSIFITETTLSDVKGFFKHIGAPIAQTAFRSKLLFSDVDMDMITTWIKEAEVNNPDSKAMIIDGVKPEKYIKEIVKSFNLSGNDEPKGDLETGDDVMSEKSVRNEEQVNISAGVKDLMGIVIEKDNKISALTHVKIYPGKEKLLSQSFTGVPEEYRGRKLGKWIKAKMIQYITSQYPESEAIVTGNADSNAPMLHINIALGYKKYKEEFIAQITLENIKGYLNSKITTITT